MSSANKNFDLQNTCPQTVIPFIYLKITNQSSRYKKNMYLNIGILGSYNTFILNICFFGYVLKPLTWESRNTSELEIWNEFKLKSFYCLGGIGNICQEKPWKETWMNLLLFSRDHSPHSLFIPLSLYIKIKRGCWKTTNVHGFCHIVESFFDWFFPVDRIHAMVH